VSEAGDQYAGDIGRNETPGFLKLAAYAPQGIVGTDGLSCVDCQ